MRTVLIGDYGRDACAYDPIATTTAVVLEEPMAAGTVLEFMPDPPPTGAPAPDGAAELARVPEPLGALGSACGAPAWQPDARNSSVTARTQTDPLRVLVPLS